MKVNQLLALLAKQHIELWVESGQLRYRAPSGTLTPELRALIVEHKPALLEQLAPASGQLTSIAQAAIWGRDQLQPGARYFNTLEAVYLLGPLEHGILQASLAEVVRRHAVLRSSFKAEFGQVIQIERAVEHFRLPQTDLSDTPTTQREARVQTTALEIAIQPYDLENGNGFRPHLLKLATDEYVLLLNFHLMIIDGWSVRILFEEITQAYRAIQGGQSPNLPELHASYADFSSWQRQTLPELIAGHLPFWQERLNQHTGQPILEPDHDRPSGQPGVGASYDFLLEPELLTQLNQFARQVRLTPFVILLSALAVLLQQHAGQPRFWLAYPTSYRNRLEFEGLIGRLVNTVYIPIDLSQSIDWPSLFKQVQRELVVNFDHQDLPVETLLDQLAQHGSQAPRAQVSLNLHNFPSGTGLDLPGIQAKAYDLPLHPSQNDVQIFVRPRQDSLYFQFYYNPEIFAQSTIERLAKDYHHLLRTCLRPDAGLIHPTVPPSTPQPVEAQARLSKAPHSPVERGLAQIWAELLNRQTIGQDDNFFELGGNSLRAVQLCHRIEQKWGVAIPLIDLFEASTLIELAQVLVQLGAE